MTQLEEAKQADLKAIDDLEKIVVSRPCFS